MTDQERIAKIERWYAADGGVLVLGPTKEPS